MFHELRRMTALYLDRQASSRGRYLSEQLLMALLRDIPTVFGIGMRAVFYRLMLHMDGQAAIERGVRLCFADHIWLGKGVYLDEDVYLHACPAGIRIGAGTLVMHGSILHVYNFRDLPRAGIEIGEGSLIGERNILRGQGGISIGSRVYTAPLVQILAVNHVYQDPTKPFVEQGITAEGIQVGDDVWIGAGAVVTDGVSIGQGAVVGAGAVVTRDVPEHTLVAGVPAKVVRKIEEPPQMPSAKIYFSLKDQP